MAAQSHCHTKNAMLPGWPLSVELYHTCSSCQPLTIVPMSRSNSSSSYELLSEVVHTPCYDARTAILLLHKVASTLCSPAHTCLFAPGLCLIGLLLQDQHALFAQYLRRAYKVPAALGRWLGRSGLVTKHWRFNPSTQAAFQAQAVMGFYDTWVARSCSLIPFLLTHILFCCNTCLVYDEGACANNVN